MYVRGDGLSGVVVSDHEYPSRVAHTMITKILDEFSAKVSPDAWQKGLFIFIYYQLCVCDFGYYFLGSEACSAYPVNTLSVHLAHWQNPKEADAMTRIQDDLDETKIILVS